MSVAVRKPINCRTEKNDNDLYSVAPKKGRLRVVPPAHDPGNPSALPLVSKTNGGEEERGRPSQHHENKTKIDKDIHFWKYSGSTRSNRGILPSVDDAAQISLGPPDLAGSGAEYSPVSITLPKDLHQKLLELAAKRGERISVTARKILEVMADNPAPKVKVPETERLVVNLTREFLDKAEKQASSAGASRARLIVSQLGTFFDAASGQSHEAPKPRETLSGTDLHPKGVSKAQIILSADTTPQMIGEQLRALRKSKGLTQLQLGQAMGLSSYSTVAALENPPNGQTVIALCAALAALDAFELPSQPQSDADGLTLLSAKAIPELIGQRLREARERKGLTQLQLAQAMGLTTSRTVQDLERPRKKGQSIIGLQSAISALGVDGL